MQKKLRAVVLLATGLSALVVADLGGNLISQASAKSTPEAPEKVVKAQGREASPPIIKAVPGTPDGVLLMQAQALFGKLPATMPGSEKHTISWIRLC